MMALEAVRCIRKILRTFENQPVWRVATPPSSALFRVLVVQVAAARVQDAIAKFRASVHQTFCNSFPEGHSKCGQRSKPRRVSVPLSWAQVPSCTGFSSRAARDLCPGCARLWKRFVPGRRRSRSGREGVLRKPYTGPASYGIYFPRTLGWVLMTAGYLPV